MKKSRFFCLKIFFASFVMLTQSCNKGDNLSTNESTSEVTKVRSDDKIIWDGIYEIRNGKEVDLTKDQFTNRRSATTSSATYEFYEIATLHPPLIFLGSVLTAASINSGRYVPAGSSSILKDSISVSFTIPVLSQRVGIGKTETSNAIARALGDKNFSGKQSQVFSYKLKQMNRFEELKLAFGANINLLSFFSVDASVNKGNIRGNSALFVDFSQTYFNMAMDMPIDGNIYKDEASRNIHLRNKPVYVNSINYGRKGVIMIESQSQYQELSTAVRAAFSAKIVNGELSLETNKKKLLEESYITICILGGDGQQAAKTVLGFAELQNYIINGGGYTTQVYGVPISFTGSYASDNSVFVSEFDLSN